MVSTPYIHATEILSDGHGVLVDFGDVAGFARALTPLVADPAARDALSQRAYARGRTMIWPRLADRAMQVLRASLTTRPPRRKGDSMRPKLDLTPLQPDLTAVERMSDTTGMMQHSIYSIPDRRHGYCIDDNARALILMSRMPGIDDDVRDKWTSIYGSFLQHAWNPDRRRFRNFMNFDRSWCEEEGSEDSNGRTIWALGVTASEARAQKHRDWAAMFFDTCGPIALDLGSPRARAFTMLGAAAMLESHPGHALSQKILTHFGEELVALLDTARRPEWQWFEIVLAYDNARMPEAMIRAGIAMQRPDFIRTGIDTLQWIVDRQTSPEGRFRAVGTESFGRPYADPLPFDQQPLEAQATIDACVAAHRATREPRWVEEALRAYRWYLGANDLELPLATARDGGCFDGLMPSGLNRNQGAESILALQLANCAISALSKPVETVAGPTRAVA